MSTPPDDETPTAAALDLDSLPGNAIRRLQQIAVAIFLQEAEPQGVTPVQFATLQALANTPDVDQRTLARSIGFDTSTIASVMDRLEARGLVQRSRDPNDGRVRLLALTPQGHALLSEVVPAMHRTQARILEPLPAPERAEFMRMLLVLVKANNALSRAPSEG
ncbi:MAG TPA: MarR family winged helix-turn-helix transcriptional regulator [Ideonella sp.]|jgi:DNA-binding MarR family transcriptional regulator|nr:MarR family winged helix-turn-helix transcriptional regulator [Ideonella sp.]